MVIQHFNRIIQNKWVWGVFAVLISVFFAFDFLFTGASSGAASGELEGRQVSELEYRTFNTDIRTALHDARQGEAEYSDDAERLTWEAIASADVAKAYGLSISDEAVQEAVMGSFRGADGNFAREQYQLFLQGRNVSSQAFEEQVRRTLTRQAVDMFVSSASGWLSPAEVVGSVADQTDAFTVRLATFENHKPTPVQADEKVLRAYYDQVTNAPTHTFQLPDCLTVKFIRLAADQSNRLAQVVVDETALRAAFDANPSRFEVKGTNGTSTVRTFTEITAKEKALLDHEIRLREAVDSCATNVTAQIFAWAEEQTKKNDPKADFMVDFAKATKSEIQTSKPFATDGAMSKENFVVRPETIAPETKDFAELASKCLPENPYYRYTVVYGTNCVYLVQRFQELPARTLTFKEAQTLKSFANHALREAQKKNFKEHLEKVRGEAVAKLAKGAAFDAKLLPEATVSTSMVYTLQGPAPSHDLRSANEALRTLQKGTVSDVIETALPKRMLLVWLEKREAGKVTQEVVDRSKMFLSMQAMGIKPEALMQMQYMGMNPSVRALYSMPRPEMAWQSTAPHLAWRAWNLKRMGFKAR